LIITAIGTQGDEGEGAIYNGSVPSVEKLWAETERRDAKRFTKDGDGVYCARTKILRSRDYRFTLSPRALGTIHTIGNNGNIAERKAKKHCPRQPATRCKGLILK